MDDDTHAPWLRPPMSDPAVVELLPVIRVFPFESFGSRIDSLAAVGGHLLDEIRPWAEAVHQLIDEFEAALRPHRLSDDAHRAMEVLVGIDRLYGPLDELSLFAEPIP